MILLLSVLLTLDLMTDTNLRVFGMELPSETISDCKEMKVLGSKIVKNEQTGEYTVLVAIECTTIAGVDS